MLFDRIKTVLLLAALSGLLLLLGNLIGGKEGLFVALIMAVIMNGVVYFFSDKIVLSMYRAQPLDPHKYKHIYAMVADLAQRMKLPMPKLWLIKTPMANAFATGRSPHHASVAVTTGILEILDTDELRGVLAHELSHVQNRDILVSTIAATLAAAISYVARMAQYSAYYQSNRNNGERRSNPFAMLIIALFMPIAAALIQFAISRSREYLADESGVESTGEPLALASALEKLQNNISRAHLDNQDVGKASTAPLFIVYPFTGRGIINLFSTHPPMEKRIERLRAMVTRRHR